MQSGDLFRMHAIVNTNNTPVGTLCEELVVIVLFYFL